MNKTTAFTFFGTILAGVGISSYLLLGPGAREEPLAPVEPAGIASLPAEAEAPAAPPEAPKAPQVTAPANPAPASTPPVAPVGAPPATAVTEKTPEPAPTTSFKSPEAALAALAERVGARDFEGFAAVAGPDAIELAAKEGVKGLIENPDLSLDPEKPRVEISKSPEGLRWAFNFVPSSGAIKPQQLYTDLKELPDQSFDIAKVSLPLDPAAGHAANAPSVPPASADALAVAHAFSKAVIHRDYKTARELADTGAVSDERVAALMIAVEEGKFQLKPDRPLVVTLSRDDVTWVLARLESPELAGSEFAVELGQTEQSWKVNGLTFSKVLSALSDSAGAGDVAYSPIVEDPEGGDSLVLYFEFDTATITPRTARQLAIVAEILKQRPDRVIRISGHADAMGSDHYNVTLSDRRAESIRQALIGNGAKPEQVVTEAFGATKPRKPNFLPDGSDNPSGRSENRRAEVLLDF